MSAISKIIAGFLFEINGYIPMICSLVALVVACIISTCYIEPIKKQTKTNKESTIKKQLKDIGDGMKFVLRSERLKALMLATALISSLLSILVNYRTSLLQDINIPTYLMGVISAILSFSSSYGSKKQNEFQKIFTNKSILAIAFIVSSSTIIAGIFGVKAQSSILTCTIIILAFIITKFAHGMYYTIMDKYFRNFTNKDIDTKIFAVKNLFINLTSAIMGIMASFLLDKISTAYCMIIVGVVFTILYILTGKYMKTRVGLKPEEYSKEERKYDELKETQKV